MSSSSSSQETSSSTSVGPSGSTGVTVTDSAGTTNASSSAGSTSVTITGITGTTGTTGTTGAAECALDDVECYDDDWQTRCAAEESHPQTKKLCTPCPDAEQSPNFDDPVHNCAFCGMFRCEPTQGGVWQQFGETVLDVIGVSGDQCEVRIIGEVEGGVMAYECSWPLGLAPWPAIVNIVNFGELHS